MAWEHNFEAKVLKIREKELKYQKINFTLEVRHYPSLSRRYGPLGRLIHAFSDNI